MKLIMENWNNFVNEEEQVEEGIMDTIRQTARDFTGKLKSAKEMRNLVNRLVNTDPFNDPRSNEFFRDSEQLVGLIKAHGVDWMRPAAGGEQIADAGELSGIIGAYKEDPAGQSQNFESAMLNLKNALDAYIEGK